MGNKGASSGKAKGASSLDKAIQGYTAQGGELASKYPFTSEMRNELFEYTSNNSIITTEDLYRKIDLSSADYNKIFNSLYENDTYDFDFNQLQSFTSERSRAFSYGGKSQDYAILKIPKGTKINGADISKKSVYPQEKETLLGKNNFVADYSTLSWTSDNHMELTLRPRTKR